MKQVYVLTGASRHGEETWTEAVFTDEAVANAWKARLTDRQKRRRKDHRIYFAIEPACLDPREPLS